MSYEDVLQGLLKEIHDGRIGDQFNTQTNHADAFSDVFRGLVERPPESLEDAVLHKWPALYTGTPIRYVIQPPNTLIPAIPEIGDSVLYWDGKSLATALYPGATEECAAEYLFFARRIVGIAQRFAPQRVVVIDLGSGAGGLGMYIHYVGRQVGLSNIHVANLERSDVGLAVGAWLAQRYDVSSDHVLIDMEVSLDRPEHLNSLTGRLDYPDAIKLFVTRGALAPYYSQDQFFKLMRYFTVDVGVSAGAHQEGRPGTLLAEYRQLIGLPKNVPLPHKWRAESACDPVGIISKHGHDIGIGITETLSPWPHFPPVPFPTYLSWSRR